MRRLAELRAPGWAPTCLQIVGLTLTLATAAAAQPVPAAPPAPPAPAAAPAPGSDAGRPLRQQVEARFEVLPVSDGLLLRPRQPMDGVRGIEVRDGDLAIDGRAADAEELERRIGAAAAAPVKALLELDPDELRDLFGFGSKLPEPGAMPPPGSPDVDTMRDRAQDEMEARRAEIERKQEELRQRIEQEMDHRADDATRRSEEIARELERATRRHHRSSDARVVMGTPVHVQKGESTGDVVAIGGNVTVEGEVLGDAVSVGGSETIHGLVTGNAVSVGGSLHLGSDARVMGDVVSVGGTIEREPGAEVLGQVTEVSFWQGVFGGMGGMRGMHIPHVDLGHADYFDGALLRLLRCFVFVLVLILLGALAAVIARGPMERVSAAAAAEPWKAAVVGMVAIVLFAPVIALVAVLLAVSIVGIPLLLLWPFAVLACVFAAFFGYLAAAHALARWSEVRFGWKLSGPVTTVVLGLFMLHGAWMMTRLIDVVDSSRDVAGFLRIMLWLFWMLTNLGALSIGIGGVLLARRRGPAAGPAVAVPPVASPPPSGPPVHELPPAARSAEAAGAAGQPPWDEPFEGFEEPATTVTQAVPEAEAEEPGNLDEAEPGRA